MGFGAAAFGSAGKGNLGVPCGPDRRFRLRRWLSGSGVGRNTGKGAGDWRFHSECRDSVGPRGWFRHFDGLEMLLEVQRLHDRRAAVVSPYALPGAVSGAAPMRRLAGASRCGFLPRALLGEGRDRRRHAGLSAWCGSSRGTGRRASRWRSVPLRPGRGCRWRTRCSRGRRGRCPGTPGSAGA